MNDFKKILFALCLLTPLASHAAEQHTINPPVIIMSIVINKIYLQVSQQPTSEGDKEALQTQFAQEQGREKWDFESEREKNERRGRRLDKW
jgi:hypothetical protein